MSAAPAGGRDTSSSASPDIGALVMAERVTTLYELTLAPTVLGLLFCLIPTVLLWPHLPHGLLLGWFAARAAIVGLRCRDVYIFQRTSRTPAEAPVWLQRYLGLLGLDAVTWGAMGWLFHTPELPALEGVMLASMLGLAVIGTLSLSSVFRANLLFSCITFAPLMLYHLAQGTQAGAFAAVALLVFLVIALSESRRMELRTTELLRLRFVHAWVADQRQAALQTAETTSSGKTRFVSEMSQEFRTPLNGILGMTQLLERSTLDPRQREQIDIVRRSGRHLLALLNDVRDMARIESGKLQVNSGPVHIAELVNEVSRPLAETARAKGLKFQLIISPTVPKHALGDAARIGQVLHTLIGNAIKFTPPQGMVSVEIGLMLDLRAGKQLRFVVNDTGPGIKPEEVERIFTPFEQQSDSSTHLRPQRRDSTGLGLTISRELARAMGGELRCMAAADVGSLFEMVLPLQPCDDIETESAPAVDVRHLLHLGGQVLLVEDGMIGTLVTATMLAGCGLVVDRAENGEEALERMEVNAYDLVLMSCRMPVMDGFTTAQHWRSHERRHSLAHLPIIAMSSSATDREPSLAAGMDDHLATPFEMLDLLAVVQRHLQVSALN